MTITSRPVTTGKTVHKILNLSVAWTLFASGLLGVVLVGFLTSVNLLRVDESGYGDSYILWDVLHFQKTGTIYRDLTQPPYLPSLYSPLVYLWYALPGRLFSYNNPFFGPRLLVIGAFALCVVTVASITKALIPVRYSWLWGLVVASSISVMWDWTLQLRGDFPGIFFNLAAIRLLMSRSRTALIFAGISAGFATQFKFTYVAAIAAGALWLLAPRHWKKLATFVGVAILCSGGLYLLFALRESRMLSQIFALKHPVIQIRDLVGQTHRICQEPVFQLALLGVPVILIRRWTRWTLLVLFSLTSFGIATATGLQAGGNVNYFFEALFSLVPFATLGSFRLISLASRRVAVAAFVVAVIFLNLLLPAVSALKRMPRSFEVESSNNSFRRLEGALTGQRILSTVPRIALFDPNPALTEPFLLSYMQTAGVMNPQPLLNRISRSEFDVVVTHARETDYWVYRGIPLMRPELTNTIAGAYRPECLFRGYLFYLPRAVHPESSTLALKLARIGCLPAPPEKLSATSESDIAPEPISGDVKEK